MRIYYPADPSPPLKRAFWLPKTLMYLKGYFDYLRIPVWAAYLLTPYFSFVRCLAIENAPLLKQQHSDGGLPHSLGVVFFSHGLCGMRTAYSQLCSALTARGFVVVALEHADGTACVTSRDNEIIPYLRLDPNDDMDNLRKIRNNQVKTRSCEVLAAFQLLQSINEGSYCPSENKRGAEIGAFDLGSFKGRLDLKNAVIYGHSFGGATVIQVCTDYPDLFRAAIALDPWMFPLQLTEPKLITIPVLSIQSETFHSDENFQHLVELLHHPQASKKDRFGVVLETRHSDVSDIMSLLHNTLKKFDQCGTLHPKTVMSIYDQWVTDFIKGCLDTPASRILPSFPDFSAQKSQGVLFEYEALEFLKKEH